MKRFFILIALLGCAGALTFGLWSFSGSIAAKKISAIESSGREEGSDDFVADAEPFAAFPVDHQQRIDFDLERAFEARFTARELRDQMLDWLLYTVVGDSGLSIAQQNQVLYDLAPVRHGYMQPVASFDYGMTRSRPLNARRIVAVLPPSSGDEHLDLLAHVADEQRKSLGQMPTSIIPFVYDFDLANHAVGLTRLDEVPVASLYTEEAGYYEQGVTELDDLTRLMERIDDVTYAHREGGHLVLGGRKLHGRVYRGIRVEDIAAIWQSEQVISERQRQFEARSDAVKGDLERRWRNQTYRTQREKRILEARMESEVRAIGMQLAREQKELGAVDGSGFSLDPQYDFQRLAANFGEVEELLQDLAGADVELDLPSVSELRTALSEKEIIPFLRLRYQLQGSDDVDVFFSGLWLEKYLGKFRFQAARYDGELEGTEAGMVLFYTDLLAKLWALDFLNSVPQRTIADFRPMTAVAVSPVFEREVAKHNSTRVWFGPRNSGFQIANDGAELLFGRNSTRIYAASTNELKPGEEGEPAANSEAFLGWWNDHYEEVARYEPEYERLNELMKWSLIVSWLNENGDGNLLNFVAEVDVDHSNWFPQWARNNTNLRFRDWSRIGFFEPGFAGVETEAMPILYSAGFDLFGSGKVLSGGVSLAPKKLFESRPALPKTMSPALRRAGSVADSTGKIVKSADGMLATFGPQDRHFAKLSITPRAEAKMRDAIGEVARADVERTLILTSKGLEVDARVGGQQLGVLDVAHVGNGFRVGWRSRDVDLGQAFARRLSKAEDIERVMAADPQVETILQLEEGPYLVKLRGSEDWLKLAVEKEPTVDLPDGWKSRISDPDSGKHDLLLAWIDGPPSRGGLEPEGYLVVDASGGAGKIPVLRQRTRGPPNEGVPVEIHDGGQRYRASVDRESGSLYLRWDSLPEPMRQDPSAIPRLLAATDRERLVEQARVESKLFTYQVDGPGATAPGFVRSYREGRFAQAAREILNHGGDTRKAFHREIQAELEIVARLEKSGDPVAARHQLNILIERYGSQPDLSLRKALLDLDHGSPRQGADAMNEGLGGVLGDGPGVFDEINRRLARPNASPGQRRNLRAIARDAEWRDLQGQGKLPPGRVVALFEDQSIRLGFHPEGPLAGWIVGAGDIAEAARSGHVYVQDSPALSSLNWNVSLESGLHQVVSGDLGTVVRLPRGDIEHFRPAEVYTPKLDKVNGNGGGIQLVPRTPETLPVTEGTLTETRLTFRLIAPCVDGDDDDDDGLCGDDDARRYEPLQESPDEVIYLVIAHDKVEEVRVASRL